VEQLRDRGLLGGGAAALVASQPEGDEAAAAVDQVLLRQKEARAALDQTAAILSALAEEQLASGRGRQDA